MRRALVAIALAALAAGALAAPASADFGISEFDVSFGNEDGSPDIQAGAHPYAITISFEMNTEEGSEGGEVPEEVVKDLVVFLPLGFVANPTAVPRCSTVDFVVIV